MAVVEQDCRDGCTSHCDVYNRQVSVLATLLVVGRALWHSEGEHQLKLLLGHGRGCWDFYGWVMAARLVTLHPNRGRGLLGFLRLGGVIWMGQVDSKLQQELFGISVAERLFG